MVKTGQEMPKTSRTRQTAHKWIVNRQSPIHGSTFKKEVLPTSNRKFEAPEKSPTEINCHQDYDGNVTLTINYQHSALLLFQSTPKIHAQAERLSNTAQYVIAAPHAKLPISFSVAQA